jgi:phosphatidylglycerophosphate synthase/putative flippase GtrA
MHGMPEVPPAALPLLFVGAYLVVATATFSVAYGVRGWRDEEVAGRGSSVMLPMPVRQLFVWMMLPVWKLLQSARLPATAITSLALLLSLGSAIAAATGRLGLAGWLYLTAGLCDFFDGRLARDQRTASPRGAAIDSVLDRYSDAAVLAGLAWLFRGSWVLAVALVALVGSLLVSYVRARGEGLGASVKVGLMQRPERVVLLGLSMALGPVIAWVTGSPTAGVQMVTGALLLLAVATQVTAARRFAHLVRKLSAQREASGNTSQMVRASISSLMATGADFVLVMGLVSLAAPPWFATGLGCLLGAAINFGINRAWTFKSDDEAGPQALRYTIVSTSSALLNAGGVALLLLIELPDYRAAWLIARVLVFIGWNYPLQRDYVYAARPTVTSGAEGSARVAGLDHGAPNAT